MTMGQTQTFLRVSWHPVVPTNFTFDPNCYFYSSPTLHPSIFNLELEMKPKKSSLQLSHWDNPYSTMLLWQWEIKARYPKYRLLMTMDHSLCLFYCNHRPISLVLPKGTFISPECTFYTLSRRVWWISFLFIAFSLHTQIFDSLSYMVF